LDHVGTLLMATSGHVGSGPLPDRGKPGVLARLTTFFRAGSGYPLADQLRRARESIDRLADAVDALRGHEVTLVSAPPVLTEAGTRAAGVRLEQARDDIVRLTAALPGLRTRLVLQVVRTDRGPAHGSCL
jgi:hypothetical protein